MQHPRETHGTFQCNKSLCLCVCAHCVNLLAGACSPFLVCVHVCLAINHTACRPVTACCICVCMYCMSWCMLLCCSGYYPFPSSTIHHPACLFVLWCPINLRFPAHTSTLMKGAHSNRRNTHLQRSHLWYNVHIIKRRASFMKSRSHDCISHPLVWLLSLSVFFFFFLIFKSPHEEYRLLVEPWRY